MGPCVLPAGGSVQTAVQAGGEEEEGAGPPAGLHRGPDGEVLGPPQQVAGAHQASRDGRSCVQTAGVRSRRRRG